MTSTIYISVIDINNILNTHVVMLIVLFNIICAIRSIIVLIINKDDQHIWHIILIISFALRNYNL